MNRELATVIEAFAAAGRPLPPELTQPATEDRAEIRRMNTDNRARNERLRARANILRGNLQ